MEPGHTSSCMEKRALQNQPGKMEKVYIILVNWNGWRDTIECLESVLRIEYPNYAVLVCDNASTDGSFDQIAAWARGTIAADCRNPLLQSLTAPAISKPLRLLKVELGDEISLGECAEKLILVQTGKNLGFAGANNFGLRLGLLAGDLDYAWLLNNDTVVDPGALTGLLDHMHAHPDAGMCGSTLLYYDDPHRVQALGGSTYNRWTARIRHIGVGLNVHSASNMDIERRMAYVVGASMLVSRHFVETIGFMEESYFLYSEEIDWATRAKGRFTLRYAPESIVYHKEGGSTGLNSRNRTQSLLVDYYGTRNRLAFTWRFSKFAIPTVLLAIGLGVLWRLCRGRFRNAFIVVRAMIDAAIQFITGTRAYPSRLAGRSSGV